MNIINKAALKSLEKSRARTLVTMVGVALSSAMITAVATFGVSLLSYMIGGASQMYGHWHVAYTDVPEAFVRAQASDKAVEETAAFENGGYAVLDGGRNAYKPYLFIAGFGEAAFDTLPITLVSGRLPQNGDEVLVPSHVAANGGVQFALGDTISLAVGRRMLGGELLGQGDAYAAGESLTQVGTRAFTVVGICQRPRFEASTAPGYTLITRADAAYSAQSYSLFVTLDNPYALRSYIDSAAGGHAYTMNDNVLRFMGLSSDRLFNMLLYAIGGIVLAIIMIGSVFLIYNSFNISLSERTQQFGILASVGATAKQLRGSVLFEGLCIGAVGIPVGVAVGVGGIALVLSLVARNFGHVLYAGVPFTMVLSMPAILASAVFSMITILISAYIPAKKAASMPVMDCIRQTSDIKVEAKAIKTSPIVQRICGLTGTLALKNFRRNKKRYRSIVLSLVLSIVLFVSAGSFVANLTQASSQMTAYTTYDIALSAPDMADGELFSLFDKLMAADGVSAGSYQELVQYSCAARRADISPEYLASAGPEGTSDMVNLPVDIQFVDEHTYMAIVGGLGLAADEYTGANAKVIALAKQQGDGEAQSVEQMADLFTGGEAVLAFAPDVDGQMRADSAHSVVTTFVSFVPPDTPPSTHNVKRERTLFFQVIAPYSLRSQLEIPAAAITSRGLIFSSAQPTQSASEMGRIIEAEGVTTPHTLYNVYKMMDENRNTIFIVNVFAYTFIVMITLIALANVLNTISTNIKLRRRELAMLRSVGMSGRDFQRMMNFECAFYGMRALLFGLPLAAVTSYLIYRGMALGGADVARFVLPWRSMLISICSVFLVIFITMLYAVRKIKRENIIDALRDDMA